MPPEKHALLGASSAERWLMCPPSARLGEQFPDTASEYAAAGTLAHAIAELKARKYFVEPMSNRAFNARLKKLKEDPHYDKGMDAATDTYLEHLKALAMSYGSVQPFVALETRVDFGDCVPEGFGTTDCIIIGAGRMCVADYKNGAGVLVEAEANPQMMLYALGALKVYAPIYGDTIREVHLSIVQPNAGGVREWDTTVEALREWGEKVVKPAAALAWEGKGDFAPGAVPEGDGYDAKDTVLTDAQVGDVLTRALEREAWVKDLKDYALTASLHGHQIAGWKAVEGRSSREWADQDTAFATLQERGIPEALLWERKPASVAGLEKALGKKPFEEASFGLVVKKPGKPTLAPESDKRPPYSPAEAAFQGVTSDA